MSTNDQHEQLRDSLQNLQGALEQAQPAGKKAQQAVEGLKEGVQGTLAHPGVMSDEHYHSLREQLNAAIDHFERDHPELTLAIGQVLDNLAAIGI